MTQYIRIDFSRFFKGLDVSKARGMLRDLAAEAAGISKNDVGKAFMLADVDPVAVFDTKTFILMYDKLCRRIEEIGDRKTSDSEDLELADMADGVEAFISHAAKESYVSFCEALHGFHANAEVDAFVKAGAPEIDAFIEQHAGGGLPADFCQDARGAVVLRNGSNDAFARIESDNRGIHVTKAHDPLALVDPEAGDEWVHQGQHQTVAAAWLQACEVIGCEVEMDLESTADAAPAP